MSIDMENSSNAVAKIIDLSQMNSEECLTLIGATQVSSILETLTTQNGINEEPKNDEETVKTKSISPSLIKETIVPPQPNISDNFEYISCLMCPFFSLNKKTINEHIDLIHKTQTPIELFEIKCPVCTNIFYHKLSFQAHLSYDHCLINEDDINKTIQVALHGTNKVLLENSIEKIPECKIENDKSLSVQDESDVNDNFVEKITVTNEIPAKKMNDTIMKILGDRNYYRCTTLNCKVRLQDQDKLLYHVSCHNNKEFKCPECSSDFSLWKSLAGHLWRVHKIDMELFQCDLCDYRTYSLGKLNNTHKLIHSDFKGFVCSVCNKSFKNNKQLKNHQGSHRKPSEHAYSCDDCKKTFATKHQMKIHVDRVHKKIRPYLCSYCGYKGGTRSALKMHVRQHTGEKPFSCDQCRYSTSDHNSLRRHKLLHTGEKPYKCTQCDYQCIQSSTYKAHISMKHPGLDKKLLFSCPMCQFLSISKDIYDLHVASQHPELKQQ